MTERITITTLLEMKARGEKITALTAYDVLAARLLDRAGVDLILVGDSLGMVVMGYENTLPVTMEEMLHHTRAVSRGVARSLVVADMPFMSYQTGPVEALHNAGRFLKEAGAHAVKLEGGREVAPQVRALVQSGIPVLGHTGLTPQSVHQLGGFRVQGREQAQAERFLADALALEEAGAFGIVLECIPAPLAREISQNLSIPTIGIGAGVDCDGQILVVQDLLGMDSSRNLKFVRRYANLEETISGAVRSYLKDVKSRAFPGDAESFGVKGKAKQIQLYPGGGDNKPYADPED
ncbi:MAG: 3-methyl-2-oxobutanoate hydroxymethyltransferase [Bacillota bacterium]